VLLARSCSEFPSLRTFAAYASFLLHERCNLERTAHVLLRAAACLAADGLLHHLQLATPPWRAGIGHAPDRETDDQQTQARQLATMARLLLTLERFDFSALQVRRVLSLLAPLHTSMHTSLTTHDTQASLAPKREVLRLGELPPVFHDWLEPAEAEPDAASAQPAPLSFLGSAYDRACVTLTRARRRLLQPVSEGRDIAELGTARRCDLGAGACPVPALCLTSSLLCILCSARCSSWRWLWGAASRLRPSKACCGA